MTDIVHVRQMIEIYAVIGVLLLRFAFHVHRLTAVDRLLGVSIAGPSIVAVGRVCHSAAIAVDFSTQIGTECLIRDGTALHRLQRRTLVRNGRVAALRLLRA